MFRTFKLLLWLKVMVTLRSFAKNPSQSIGAVLALLFLSYNFILAGVTLMRIFSTSSPEKSEVFLIGLLHLFLIIFLSGGLVEVEFHEGYDISKLLLYPITFSTLLNGIMLGSLMDMPILFLLPLGAVIAVSFGNSLSALILIILTLLVFIFCIVCIQKLVSLAVHTVLSARKVGWLILVALILVASSLGLIMLRGVPGAGMGKLSASAVSDTANIYKLIVQSPLWNTLKILPSGISGSIIIKANENNFIISLLLLASLVTFTLIVLHLTKVLLEKVYTGTVVYGKARAVDEIRRVRISLFPWFLVSRSEVRGVIEKEFKYFARSPEIRSTLLMPIFGLLIALPIILKSAKDISHEISLISPFFITAFLLFFLASLPLNIFGIDKDGAEWLFLLPAKRKYILIGKNLAQFTVISCFTLIAFIIVGPFLKTTLISIIAALLMTETILFIYFAVGNIVSAIFPVPLISRDNRPPKQSFFRALVMMVVLFIVLATVFLLSLPIAISYILPILTGHSWILLISVPLSAAYTALIYFGLLQVGSQITSKFESHIISNLSQQD